MVDNADAFLEGILCAAGAGMPQLLAIDLNGTAIGDFRACQEPDQRRLPRAVLTEKCPHLAGRDFKGRVVKSKNPRVLASAAFNERDRP
ncbi:hypothetical protein FHX05_005289 [Rhizobium sp. BK491]|nr:hypothetical protein [Rhizobium sp. BK491]